MAAMPQTAAMPQKDDDDKMLTKRQQQVLKAIANNQAVKVMAGLWCVGLCVDENGLKSITFGASTLYALAHHGLVAFVDAYTVSPTPKGEALAALLDETTMVTRRGVGVVIS